MARLPAGTTGSTATAAKAGWLLCAAALVAACGGPAAVPVDAVHVEMTAHKADWRAVYRMDVPDGAPRVVGTGREVHVPVGAAVTLTLTSAEYITTFDAPRLGLRDFAAPGLPGRFEFRADTPGRYELRADEMCGLPHPEQFVGSVVVESAEAYRAWVRARMKQEM